jgi:hypothetical protein
MNVPTEGFSPLDYTKLFVNDEIIQTLVEQSNVYAERRIEGVNLKLETRLRNWYPVTLDEMKVFLSLVLVMGLVQKDDIEKYWSNSDIDETPYFSKNMSRNCFQSILSNFHITDNELQPKQGEPGFDPLFNFQPFISSLKINIFIIIDQCLSYRYCNILLLFCRMA